MASTREYRTRELNRLATAVIVALTRDPYDDGCVGAGADARALEAFPSNWNAPTQRAAVERLTGDSGLRR